MTQPISIEQQYFRYARAANGRPVDAADDRTAFVHLFDVRRNAPWPSMRRAAERILEKQGYVFDPCGPGSAA